MEQRCQMCFKVKVLTAAQQGLAVQVCKGCFYEIDRVVGFLEMATRTSDGQQSVMPDLGTDEALADNPPTPQKSTENAAGGRRRRKTPDAV